MINYLKIIRPINLGIIVLTQVFLYFFIIKTYLGLGNVEPAMNYLDLAMLVLSTVLIAAGGNVINDYYDIEADESNKPGKQIAGKLIPMKNLWIYYWVLSTLGVLIGLYQAFKIDFIQLGFIFPVVAIMLWLYSSRYQKTVLYGNLMVAFMSAMVILILWLFEFFTLKTDPIHFVEAMKQITYLHYVVTGYAVFAFLVSLVREIVKDVEDVEGDRRVEAKTFPIVFGNTKSRNLAMVVHILAMLILGVCQYYLYLENLILVFWYLMLAVQLLFLFVLFQLTSARTKKDFHFLSNAYKMIMLAGILSMQLFYISY